MNRYGGRMIDRIADTRDDAEMERLLGRFPPVDPGGDGDRGLLPILYLMPFKPSFPTRRETLLTRHILRE